MNVALPAKLMLEPIRFGEFLYERDLLDDEQLLDVLADHWSSGGRIGCAVARRGYMSREDIELQARAYHGLEVVEVGRG
ncbi:MAG TPA: hypothetical protein VML75_05505 [Kofleriaceae bacterium]|nr:hypothetical protein [Kofleriaceae bacterium]